MDLVNSKDSNKLYSGTSVAKNTIYNLFGFGIPLTVAIALIPPLITGLGEEKFGILNLAWIVIGYFSFFDFGIGRSLTKIIAEKIGLQQTEGIPGIFWTSFFLMLAVSLIGTLLLLFITPLLVNKFFNISQALRTETKNTFYALALSIPVVTTAAGLRGVLEAYQKFGSVNIIRIALGVFTFLGPLLCLIFTESLLWVVLVLIFIRIIVWCTYLLLCFKTNGDIKNNFEFDPALLKPVLTLSGWMTISNLIGPLILYLDRFLIGAVVSASAITYYATPYEVVTKLLVIPSALVGVLFPVFSGSFFSNPEFSKKILFRSSKYIFLFLFPIVFLTVTFSYEGLYFWLGERFAQNSSTVLQLLAAGVLLNSVAFVPFTFLQGIGRADIPAKINLIELPFYVAAMWIAVKEFGINGAAFVWVALNFVNAVIQLFIVKKLMAVPLESKYGMLSVFVVGLAVPFIVSGALLKAVISVGVLFTFIFASWKYLLHSEEKAFLISKLKMPINYFISNES